MSGKISRQIEVPRSHLRGFEGNRQTLLHLPKRFLGSKALGNVAEYYREEFLSFQFDLRDRGFDRKLLAVAAATTYRPALAHRYRPDVALSETGNMPPM